MQTGEGDQGEGGEADAGAVPGALPHRAEGQHQDGDERELAEFDTEIEAEQGRERALVDVFRLHEAVGKGEAVDGTEDKDHQRSPALQTGGIQALDAEHGDAETDADLHPMTRHSLAGEDHQA